MPLAVDETPEEKYSPTMSWYQIVDTLGCEYEERWKLLFAVQLDDSGSNLFLIGCAYKFFLKREKEKFCTVQRMFKKGGIAITRKVFQRPKTKKKVFLMLMQVSS